jgi:hypothetical protein
MPDDELSGWPIFLCRLCGLRIPQSVELFMTASWVAHFGCLERRRSAGQLGIAPIMAAPLTADERRSLFRFAGPTKWQSVAGAISRTGLTS